MASKNNPNELYLTRLYDAPVKTVWEAWTDTEQVAKWWGPRGFTITTHSKDVKVGGTWNYTMHGPDGVDYPNKTKYLEIEEYSKLVYDHGGYDDRPPMFRVTVLFSEIDGKTKMEMTMVLPSAEATVEAKKIIKKANGNSTWDRLAEYLTPSNIFVINQSFEAPIELLFQMWTDPKHLCEWLPPTGFTMKYLKQDIKVGSEVFYKMTNLDGLTIYGKANYKEITPLKRIVYTQIFCDENETVCRHPMAQDWPETLLTSINFYEESANLTRVKVTMEPYGKCTSSEIETFLNARGGMTQGWSGSFDKLEDLLANQAK